MRVLTRSLPLAKTFGVFFPGMWVLAFIGLVAISVAWLAFTQPPTIRPSMSLLSAAAQANGEDAEALHSVDAPLFTAGLKDSEHVPGPGETDECLRTLSVDVDGDGRSERVCVREAVKLSPDGRLFGRTLIVDIFKRKTWFLRQELDPGLFTDERFHMLRDIDMDGSADLVTFLSNGSNEQSEKIYRLHRFDGYAFVEAMHLFGLPPQDASVAYFLRRLAEIQEEINTRYAGLTGMEDLCGDSGEEGDCFAGAPWLLDSNGDGRLELVQMLEPPGGRDAAKAGPFRLFVKEFRRRGTEGRSRFHSIGPGAGSSQVGSILFHRSSEGRVLLLASFTNPGALAAPDTMAAFELSGTGIKKTAGFGGFTVPEKSGRLRLAHTEEMLETRWLK
jgi:hypothetical protein